MRIFKSSLITTLIAGLLFSAIPLEEAFAQRGGGNRGGGSSGRNAGGGGGGNRGGEGGGGTNRGGGGGGGGQRSFSGGQMSGGRSRGSGGQINRGPSRSEGGSNSARSFNQGQRSSDQVNRDGVQRTRDGQRTVDGNRDQRSFTDRNFQGDGSRSSNYRGDNYVRTDRDGNRSNNNIVRDNRNRNDFDRGRYTDFNRGNYNRGNSNSQFFGPRGAFGNVYLGRGGFGTYGNYGRGYGYGGWNGYGGYGLGYGRYGGYGFLPFLGGLGLGYGSGYGGYGLGYGGYGLGYGAFGPAYGGYYSPNYVQTVPQTITSDAQPAPPPADTSNANGTDFAAMGEAEFRAGNYQAAMMAFRHALVEEPNNAGLMLLISQCLFQMGEWTEAAGATELAMGALPEDKWGTVVQNYTQLYGNIEDYTRQLKELENAVKQDPNSPALRFLIGFHFGYLSYPQQAVRELSKSVQLEGRDPAARRLHDIFAAKIGAPTVGPVPRGQGSNETGGPAGSPTVTPQVDVDG